MRKLNSLINHGYELIAHPCVVWELIMPQACSPAVSTGGSTDSSKVAAQIEETHVCLHLNCINVLPD